MSLKYERSANLETLAAEKGITVDELKAQQEQGRGGHNGQGGMDGRGKQGAPAPAAQ